MGRTDELAQLRTALSSAHDGHLSVVIVEGQSGMGKTRLVREFIDRIVDDHGTVCRTGCTPETGPGPAFDLVQDAVRSQLALPDDRPRGAEHQIRDLADHLATAAESSPPLTLVIEDIQWADEATRLLLRFIAHAMDDTPLLLVVTHHPMSRLPRSTRALVATLDRMAGAQRLHLGPLSRDEARRLISQQGGDDVPDELVDELVTRAAGVTLFLEELAAERHRVHPAAVPARLRDLFNADLDRLPAGALDLLEIAAVCGPVFGHDLVTAVAELPDGTLSKRIDTLLNAGMLVIDDDARDYTFRHLLLHQTVLQRLRPTRRRQLHAHCARVLQLHPSLAAGTDSIARQVATHWRGSGQAGPAFHATLEAARDATNRQLHREAMELELDALDRWTLVPRDERGPWTRPKLRMRAARSASRAGDHASAAALHDDTLEEVGDDPMRFDVQAEASMARYLAGDVAGAARLADLAWTQLPDDAEDGLRAVLLALWSSLCVDDLQAGLVDGTARALRIAQRTGDRALTGTIMSTHGLGMAVAGRLDEAREVLDEAERLSLGAADPRDELRPLVYRLLALRAAGASREVLVLAPDAVLRADQRGVSRSVGQQLRTVLADAQVALGQWDAAAQTVAEGLAWGDESLAGTLLLSTRVDVAIGRGHFRAAARDLETLRARNPAGHFRISAAQADLAWWRGDPASSRLHARRGLSLAARVSVPDEWGRLAHAFVRASVAHDAEADALDTPARDVLERLAAKSTHPVIDGWHAATQATVRGARGQDPSATHRAWSRARQAWTDLGHVPQVATTCWQLGLAAAATGDATAAHAHFDDASGHAEALGATPLLVEVRAARAQLPSAPAGIRHDAAGGPSPMGATLSTSTDWDLTPRQAEVLNLLSRGWTNRRIGRELEISPRTVGVHVSAILERLGVATRTEAVAVAHREAHVAALPAPDGRPRHHD